MMRHLVLAAVFGIAWSAPRFAVAAPIDTDDRAAVVAAYRSEYLGAESPDPEWTGNLRGCSPGVVNPAYLRSGLKRLNWFRAMAGLPPIDELDVSLNAQCQRAALLMTANRKLSHTPSASWKCWSKTGAEAASKSNLAGGYLTLADAITGWILDERTPTAGHRRWILYPPLQRTGIGATFGNEYPAYVMWTMGGTGSRRTAPDGVAWPPPGFVPYTVVNEMWSFAYPRANFAKAHVRMTRDGTSVSVSLEALRPGFGDNALVWTVPDWKEGAPARDVAYEVTLSNVLIGGEARSFRYAVTVIDPLPGDDELRTSSRYRMRAAGETTTIRYELQAAGDVSLVVYDEKGQQVVTLVSERKPAGRYEVVWDGTDAAGRVVPAGRYTCRLQAGTARAVTTIVRTSG